MPHRLFVKVEVDNPALVQPQHLHAVVCRWMEGPSVNHQSSHKPFSLSPFCEHPQLGHGFEIAILDDDLVARFGRSIQADLSRTLHFGPALASINQKPPIVVTNSATWAQLARQAHLETTQDTSHLTALGRIEAETPLLARQGNTDLIEPRAGSFVVNLSKRWTRLSPLPLHPGHHIPALAHCEFTEIDGTVETIQIKNRVHRGFVGYLELAADGSPASIGRVDALLAMSNFAGAGSMTTYGCGVVSVERIR